MEKSNRKKQVSAEKKERIERYLKFVVFFNRFIKHRRKFRRPFIERDMRI